MEPLGLPIGKRYTGKIELGVDFEDARMDAHLYTDRLHLESIKARDVDDYARLFGDADVMGLYASGTTRSYEQTAARIKSSWIPRWEKGYPFSAFVIRDRETDAFIGHIVAGDGDDMGFDKTGQSGYSEMAYLVERVHWNKGLGKEAAAAVVDKFIPYVVEKKYEVMTGVGGGEEKSLPLKWLTATARIGRDTDGELLNPASIRILTGLDFVCRDTGEKFGHYRGYFGREF